MLKLTNVDELLEITQKAIEYMEFNGYEDDFFVESIVWNDDEFCWVVGFHCDRGNIDDTKIVVRETWNGHRHVYQATGQIRD